MYEAVGVWLERITAVVCGYCLQSFLGSFSKYNNRVWKGLAAVVLYGGWEYFGGRILMPAGGFGAVIRLGGGALISFFLTRLLYRQTAAMAAFLAVSFLAVREIGAYLVHVVAMAGDGLNYLLLRFSENGRLAVERAAELAEGTAMVIQFALYVSLWALLYTLLRRLASNFREKDVCLHKKEALLLMLPGGMGLLFCLLLRLLMFQGQPETGILLYDRVPAARLIVPAVLALVQFLILYAVRLYQDIFNLQKERNARMVLETQLNGLREQMEEMEHVYSGIRGLRHDMRNSLAVVTELLSKCEEENCSRPDGEERSAVKRISGDDAKKAAGERAAKGRETQGSVSFELRSYVEEWNRSLAGLEFRFRTGNVVADVLLERKQRELIRSVPGVMISADDLIFPDGLFICGYDLGVILGNALDNAMEACKRLKEKEPDADVFLKLCSFVKGRAVLLEITNSFDGQIVCERNREFPASRKAESGFCGIGLMNVKATAEKYHGTVEWAARGRCFVLTVLLQNERSEENDKR